MSILFKHDVQSIISSLSFSNFKIVNNEAIKKPKGINFETKNEKNDEEYVNT